MSERRITAITTTFGRQKHLEHAIECFLQQTHPNRRMVILNTFQDQKYYGDFPNVQIINLPVRPKSLGEARNMAIEQADGEIIVTWDDDDLYHPNHLASFDAHFTDGIDWVWQDREFYAERGRILKIAQGQMPCVAFKKEAWRKIGGYSELTVGEDRQFVGKLTAACQGKKTELRDDEITFIYSWNNSSYHISGLGDDKPGQRPAHIRIEEDLKKRIRQGDERVGKLRLRPNLVVEPAKMIAKFFDIHAAKTLSHQSVCIVQLGRYGDIINLLPICRHIAENYGKPYLMVAREFASLLEGISYVIPEIFDGPYDQLASAMRQASQKFKIVLRGQIYGKGHTQERKSASYNRESWRELGFDFQFYDVHHFKPVFDLRNVAREAELAAKTITTKKPLLLVQVTNSVSSPFIYGVELLERIQIEFGQDFEVVNMAEVRGERLYDLLGLLDKAVGLISCDTALLHLAAASDVRVISLVNPKPWLGSICRCNEVAHSTYDDFQADHSIVSKAIKNHLKTRPQVIQNGQSQKIKPATKRKIWHAVERHVEVTVHTRKLDAWRSWDDLYASGKFIPAHYTTYLRDARSIGSSRELPFLKDVLSHAMNNASDEDIICFTNDDIHLHPELPTALDFYVSVYGAVCSQRCDFKMKVPVGSSPDEVARRGGKHLGRDLFAFTKEWLEENWGNIPDFIIGASDFDLCLAAMIRLKRGISTDRKNIVENYFPSELPRGYISHIEHKAKWTEPDIENKDASQIWNRRLWREWAAKHLPDLQFTAHNTI